MVVTSECCEKEQKMVIPLDGILFSNFMGSFPQIVAALRCCRVLTSEFLWIGILFFAFRRHTYVHRSHCTYQHLSLPPRKLHPSMRKEFGHVTYRLSNRWILREEVKIEADQDSLKILLVTSSFPS